MTKSILVGLILLTGCATTPIPTVMVSGYPLKADWWNQTVTQVTTVASFELNCPPDQIKLAVLNVNARHELMGGFSDLIEAVQVGAEGCNQRRVYVPRGGNWVSTTTSTTPDQ